MWKWTNCRWSTGMRWCSSALRLKSRSRNGMITAMWYLATQSAGFHSPPNIQSDPVTRNRSDHSQCCVEAFGICWPSAAIIRHWTLFQQTQYIPACLRYLLVFVDTTIWRPLLRYDTIAEFNLDSKAECDQLNLAHVARKKYTKRRN